MEVFSSLGIAYATYIVGTVSPGPANLLIMSTALQQGRSAGVASAFGVITGSFTWGLVSAFGLGALLSTWPALLNALSFFGGCYLCFLAWGALRKSLSGAVPELSSQAKTDSKTQQKYFLYGLALHLTNPKAMFVWISVIALGLPQGSEGLFIPLLIVAVCCITGVFIFGSYALVFSNEGVVRFYLRGSRVIEAVIAAFFSVAGLSLFYRSIASYI